MESIDIRHGDPVIDIMSRREVTVINSYFYWRLPYQLVRTGPDQSGPDPEYLSKRLESIDSRHGDPVIDIMSRREVAVINFYRIAQIQFFRGDQGGMQVRFHASGTKK